MSTVNKIHVSNRQVPILPIKNLGQDGGRVCYFIQNGVSFLLEIEWEVF